MNIKELWDNPVYKSIVSSLQLEEANKVRALIDSLIHDQTNLVPKGQDIDKIPKKE
jgi:hypothetical protein